jgi:choline kinase
MKAIILSAGLGSRLLPLTADRPKCLVSAGGRTILEHQLIALRDSGVDDVTVVGGYKFDRLSQFVGRMDRAIPQPRLVLNPFYAVSSSIGSVWAARDLLGGPFCILNGDTLYDPQILSDGLARLAPGVNLFIETRTEPVHDDMLVRAADGRVLEVGKGLNPAEALHRSLGIVACADVDGGPYRAMLQLVIAASGGEHRFHHDIVDELAAGPGVSAVEFEPDQWQEIDSPEDIDRWLGLAGTAAA